MVCQLYTIIKTVYCFSACHEHLPEAVTESCSLSQCKLEDIETLHLLSALKEQVQIYYKTARSIVEQA